MTAPTRRRSITTQDQPPVPGGARTQPAPASRRRRTGTGFPLALRFPTLQQAIGVEAFVAVAGATALTIPSPILLSVTLPLALLPFVVVAGRSVQDWTVTALRYASRSTLSPGVTTEMHVADGTAVGVHRWNDRVSCVLELLPPRGAETRLTLGEADTAVTIDLRVLDRCLSQHDISLCGIDVVSHGERTSSGTPASDVYEQLIGPLPAVATRNVWVVVTLDARANQNAAASRGGGRSGMDRTVHIASERVSRALEVEGIGSRILTRHEIQAAAAHMRRGVPNESLTESWQSAPLPGVTRVGYGLDMGRVDNTVMANIWAAPTLSHSNAIRLAPGSDRAVTVSGACGFVGRTMPDPPRFPGMVSMNGRQREALLTSLPLAVPPRGSSEAREMPYSTAGDLRLPTGGCGQLLGSDDSGRGIAMRIHGAGVSSVHVAGELYLAQQLVFRAVATGARVLVRTDRPHAWRSLVDSVATPDRLHIDDRRHRTGARIDLVVQDYSDPVEAPGRAADEPGTLLTLGEQPSRTPMRDPDVSIVQPGAAGDRIIVRTPGHRLELVLVTIPQETAFIGRPRSIRSAGGDLATRVRQ